MEKARASFLIFASIFVFVIGLVPSSYANLPDDDFTLSGSDQCRRLPTLQWVEGTLCIVTSVTVDSDETFRVSPGITLTVQSGIGGSGKIINSGSITTDGLGNSGTLDNFGTISIIRHQSDNTGTINNYGSFSTSPTLTNTGAFFNICTGTSSGPISAPPIFVPCNSPPTATMNQWSPFSSTDPDGTQLTSFTFSASATDDSAVVSFDWDFDGDGMPDATTDVSDGTPVSVTTTHIYGVTGVFQPQVRANDAAGANSQWDKYDNSGTIKTLDIELDSDSDGIFDGADNCPSKPNLDQTNNDDDLLGDACDTDDDNDGMADTMDNCQFVSNPDQINIDSDSLGNACDEDDDNDGVPDVSDSNPNVFTAINSGDWYDPNVWEGGIVPGPADNKQIKFDVTVSISTTLENSKEIVNSGTFVNSGTIINRSGGLIYNSETMNNSGTMINESGATIQNSGALSEGATLNNTGTIDNSGVISNNTASSLNNSGTISNSGTIGNLRLSSINNLCQGIIDPAGTFTGDPVNEVLCIPNLIFPSYGSTEADPKPDLTWDAGGETRPVTYSANLEGASSPGIPIELVSLSLISAEPLNDLNDGNYWWLVTSTLDPSYSPGYQFASSPANSATSSFGVLIPICPTGSYSATGFEPCILASPGHYVGMAGATGQLECPAGTFQPNSGATSCSQCPDGTTSGPGAIQCAAIEPTDVTLDADKDSFLRKGAKNTNEGANTILMVQKAGNKRTVISFDLSEFEGKEATSATLRLYVTYNGGNWGKHNDRMIEIHKMLSGWTEGNGANFIPKNLDEDDEPEKNRGTGQGVTWACNVDSNISNKKTDCSPKWNGGGFASAITDSEIVTSTTSGWIEFDVTGDVNSVIAQREVNFGWLIKKSNEGNSGRIGIASSEHADISIRPQLVLNGLHPQTTPPPGF